MSTPCLLQPTGINGNFNITTPTTNHHCKPATALNPRPSSIASKPSEPSTKSTICIQHKSQPQSPSHPPKEHQKQQQSQPQSQEKQTKLIKKDPIKVQNEFMDAMKNAILRCLDKNTNLSKTAAEKSVFIALGYDPSIESNKDSETTEPAPTHQADHSSDDSDDDEDDDIHKNQAFMTEIQHYRRHHIMRDRDAIRTFRIKQLHHIIIQQYPIYNAQDVLTHLTIKLNTLYLPSPSPPPSSVDESVDETVNNKNLKTKEIENNTSNKIDNIDESENKQNKNKSKSNNTSSSCDSSNELRKNLKSGHITKEKIINVGYAGNKTTNDREDNVQNIVSHKYIAHNDNHQVMIHKANINGINHKKQQQQLQSNKDVSPSSNIYVTFNNNLLSGAPMKCNKKTLKSNPAIFNMKKSTSSSSSASSTLSPSPTTVNPYNELFVSSLVDRYKANGGYLEDPFFVSPYNNEEDQVIQKMKLHKKSRKRKYDSMNLGKIPTEFEQSLNNFDNGQPAKKRTRFGNKKKNRAKTNKTTRNRSRKNNRNKYHNLRRNDNHSTDCFDDEGEENEQDIDLNANNTNNVSSH